jgi:cytochrome c peroxidase
VIERSLPSDPFVREPIHAMHSTARALLVFLLFASSPAVSDSTPYTEACPDRAHTSAISPIPIAHSLDATKVALGRALFHDPRLSEDATVACASCHVIPDGGDDGRVRSLGIHQQSGEINAPTVLNRAFDFRLFWDGRARDLRDQVDGPLRHPKEMGSSWQHALAVLQGDAAFASRFRVAYPDGLSAPNVRDAIATFEESLITPNSPVDRYLCGDADTSAGSTSRVTSAIGTCSRSRACGTSR